MRKFVWLPVCASLAMLLVVVRPSAAATVPFSFNWIGTPATPLAYQPTSDWDVQIHVRAASDTMDPMDAQHGADCSAPPATHPIVNLIDGVFLCKNHLMTAINDGGYGEIALTSDHMVDFSSGTAAIQVNVSTQQFNNSDWTEIYVSPFSENVTLPFNCCDPDLQGPPAHGLRFSLNASGIEGTHEGDVARVDNFNISAIPKSRTDLLASLLAPSQTVRTTYEIDISKSHVRFGLPGVNGGVWWTDTDISTLSFTQGVVQILHHTYNAAKHSPGLGNDTWHWSNFSISSALPFTIINGRERSIHAGGATTVHFPAPAPSGAYLRFSGIGPQGTTYKVSYDGGSSWVSPALQHQQGVHDEHFSTYWSPVPAGVQTVMFQGQDWWGGQWWVRDPAIWSPNAPAPGSSPSPLPSSSPTPGPTPSPSTSPTPTPTPSVLPTPTPAQSAAGCNNTSTGLTALTDLGFATYQGQQGGLYPGGSNVPSGAYLAAGLSAADSVVPINGRIGFVSLGMSNTSQEFSYFAQQESLDAQRNPAVVMVDGAQNGVDASGWTDPNAPAWAALDQRVASTGLSNNQVEVIWLKQADMVPSALTFQAYTSTLEQQMSSIISIAAQRYPNLRQVFVSPRTYGGYSGINTTGGGPNPEPWAYETGFADKWLVAQSVANPSQRPWVSWGPYFWTDGTRGRADGLQWLCSDTADGTHPSSSGLVKTDNMLRSMFMSSAFTPWFRGSATASPSPNPSPSPAPSPTPSPTPVPGPTGSGLTITGAPCMILFNGNELQGTCSGTFTPNPSPNPVVSPWPSSPPVPINEVPCMVPVNGSPEQGTCSGTFEPR